MRLFCFRFSCTIALTVLCVFFGSGRNAPAADTVSVSVLDNAVEPAITPARAFIPAQNGSFRISSSGTAGNLKVIYSYLSTGGRPLHVRLRCEQLLHSRGGQWW